MPDEINYYGLVNKPPIDEICNLDLVNKPDLDSDELAHWGILGMKWGIRRYQNADGTLTEAGKARLRNRRAKIEAKEAKKRIKEEKRAKREQARKEKKLSNPDPKWIERNMHKFTNEELYKAIERIKMKKNIEDIQKERLDIGKHKADTIIGYGNSLNNVLKFINSDAGKAIREKLGMSTESIFNFSAREEAAKKEKEEAKRFEMDMKRDEIRRQRDFEDYRRRDYNKREQDLIWDMRRLDYELMRQQSGLNSKNKNKSNSKPNYRPADKYSTPKPGKAKYEKRKKKRNKK